jgi:putative endonuclease
MGGLDPATQRSNEFSMPSGFVYILASKRNGTLYTGITSDLHGRIEARRDSRGSKFVAKYGVHRLVWFEEHALYADAIQRETSIKRWKRAWKLALIEKTNPDWLDLTEKWNA